MQDINRTTLTPASFILNGIPGLEDMHGWISIPFCSMYVVAMVGNCGLIYLIYYEDTLHRPMYYFLIMLSLSDIVICTTTFPNAFCIFWFNLKVINFNACLAQMFFVYTFTIVESGVLVLMALDCYVAICYPLRYTTVFTNSIIFKAGIVNLFRGMMLVFPILVFIKQLPYCHGKTISHTYCDHMTMAKVSCGNIKINAVYGATIVILIGSFDIICITVSYTMILQAVVSLSSADARQKAFGICTAHIGAIVFSYAPAFFSFLTHRFGGHTIPLSVHVIVSNLYLILPPTMNPIVYGMKTRQIRVCFKALFRTKG